MTYDFCTSEVIVWDISNPTNILLIRNLGSSFGDDNILYKYVDLDEKYLVCTTNRGTIHLWNAATLEYCRAIEGPLFCSSTAFLKYKHPFIIADSYYSSASNVSYVINIEDKMKFSSFRHGLSVDSISLDGNRAVYCEVDGFADDFWKIVVRDLKNGRFLTSIEDDFVPFTNLLEVDEFTICIASVRNNSNDPHYLAILDFLAACDN